jgi:Uma2 family endonuclease
MSTTLRKPMTMAAFLAWEERQELRFEFDGVAPLAMTGGTVAHELIGGNLRAALQQRLRGTPCRVFGPTLKIEVAGRIRYPDAFVACGALAVADTVVREPVVVFEVLSPGTSHTDRIDKLREYQATPSIRCYVIVEQDSMAATMFSRRDGGWDAQVLTQSDDLSLPDIGVAIPLAEIFADVGLPLPQAGGFAADAP